VLTKLTVQIIITVIGFVTVASVVFSTVTRLILHYKGGVDDEIGN